MTDVNIEIEILKTDRLILWEVRIHVHNTQVTSLASKLYDMRYTSRGGLKTTDYRAFLHRCGAKGW